MHVKHTKNIPFPEARKIVESYMGTRTYANTAQKQIKKPWTSCQSISIKKLIEKIINLNINEWPTFQENIKRMYSTEIKQTEPSKKTNQMLT